MRRNFVCAFLLLFLAIDAYASWEYPSRWYQWGGPNGVYDVTEYGAIADAVEASSCDSGEDIPIDCDTAGSGTNNAAAISSAVAAAVAAGGGVVYIPAGKYRIGSGTGAGFSSGHLILIQGDNVTIQGDGASTVLLPGDSDGQNVFGICETVVAGGCTTANPVYNITFRDFVIRDDDPMMHGCQWCGSLEVESISGAYTFGEVLNFTGGETAEFFWQSADTGTGRLVYMYPNGDAITSPADDGDTITGATSGATSDIITSGVITSVTSEESHGIAIYNAHNVLVENVQFDFIGDEAVYTSLGSTDVRVVNNYFRHVPSTPSAGSAINFSKVVGATAMNNDIVLGVAGAIATSNAGISVTGDSTATSNILIQGNRIIEPDDNLTDHNCADSGIAIVSGSTADVTNVNVVGNIVELDIDDASNLGCSGVGKCYAIYTTDTGAGNIEGLSIIDNNVTGSIDVDADGSVGAVVSGNTVNGSYQDGIQLNGNNLNVSGNTIAGHAMRGIYVVGTSTGNLLIDGNILRDIGADLTSNNGIIELFSTSSAENIVISNNVVVGKAVAGGNVSGIRCRGTGRSTAIGNLVEDADRNGIDGCQNVRSNTIISPTNWGIYLYQKYSEISNNTIWYAGTAAIDATTGSAFNRCFGNISYGATLSTFTVTDANLTGTPVIGDTYTANGGGAPLGVLTEVDLSGDPNLFTSIPTDVTDDNLDTLDDLEITGGAGWEMTDITVTQDATAAPAIDCSYGGSTEVDNREIPTD